LSDPDAMMDNRPKPEYEWLLDLSLMLAVILEVCPTEIGFLTSFALHRSFGMYVLTKIFSLMLIILPLGIHFYIRRTETTGERTTIWTWKVIVIVLILSLNLVMNSVAIVHLWAADK
jgi:hypothetical protein